VSRYFEVFLEVPIDVLVKRDQKGLYSGAIAGTVKNVVGMDMPFPPPIAPDLVIDNGVHAEEFTVIAERIFVDIKKRYPDWLAK
jgi:adenylylsulfate kinase